MDISVEKIIAETVTNVVCSLAQKTASVTSEKVKELLQRIADKDTEFKRAVDIPKLIQRITSEDQGLGEDAYNEDILARYLELPVRDLSTLNPDTIEIDVVFHHVKLEELFKRWLDRWGYNVEIGPTLKGLEGIEYVPDVYATLSNLHDSYEVCINFVSDQPPSELRVKALLQDIEAYSERKESFSQGDIFMIVTPRQNFTQTALTHLSLQNMQEKYSIVPLDGADIGMLSTKTSDEGRMIALRRIIIDADEEARRGRTRLPRRWSSNE